MEQFTNYVTRMDEALSEQLYHYTHTKHAASILSSNTLKATASIKTPHDEEISKRGYYISFARTLTGVFSKNRTSGVMFNFDGRKLGQNYSGQSVDYWGSPQTSEQEDRLNTDKPNIPNISKYIKSVHMIYDSSSDIMIKKVVEYSKKRNIPLFIYKDVKAWQLQNTRKSVPVSELTFTKDDFNVIDGTYTSNKPLDIYDWEELIKGVPVSSLEDSGRAILKLIQNNDKRGIDSAVGTLRYSVSHSASELQSFTSIMKKNKIKKLADVVGHVKKKYEVVKKVSKPVANSFSSYVDIPRVSKPNMADIRELELPNEYFKTFESSYKRAIENFVNTGAFSSIDNIIDASSMGFDNGGLKFNYADHDSILNFDWDKWLDVFPDLPFTVSNSYITNNWDKSELEISKEARVYFDSVLKILKSA